MLALLSEVMGTPMPESNASFADSQSIASWASVAVGQVELAGVMNGVGNNKIAPKDSYTREQSIVTMLRMYRYTQGFQP